MPEAEIPGPGSGEVLAKASVEFTDVMLRKEPASRQILGR
jgi:hypothetical protein